MSQAHVTMDADAEYQRCVYRTRCASCARGYASGNGLHAHLAANPAHRADVAPAAPVPRCLPRPCPRLPVDVVARVLGFLRRGCVRRRCRFVSRAWHAAAHVLQRVAPCVPLIPRPIAAPAPPVRLWVCKGVRAALGGAPPSLSAPAHGSFGVRVGHAALGPLDDGGAVRRKVVTPRGRLSVAAVAATHTTISRMGSKDEGGACAYALVVSGGGFAAQVSVAFDHALPAGPVVNVYHPATPWVHVYGAPVDPT